MQISFFFFFFLEKKRNCHNLLKDISMTPCSLGKGFFHLFFLSFSDEYLCPSHLVSLENFVHLEHPAKRSILFTLTVVYTAVIGSVWGILEVMEQSIIFTCVLCV